MATLAGEKVKDKFGELLKVENGNITGTLKTVEDGEGNSSALQLSSASVGIASGATLQIPSVPTGTNMSQALFIDGSPKIIKQQTVTIDTYSSDTGWKDMSESTYDETASTYYGVRYPSTMALNRDLEYRVVGRTVHLRGDLYIPLSTSGNATADMASTEEDNYASGSSTLFTGSGWTQDGSGQIYSTSIFSKSLVDEFTMAEGGASGHYLMSMWVPVIRRCYQPSVTELMTYSTFASISITDDFRIKISSFFNYAPEIGSEPVVSPIVEMLTKFTSGRNLIDYTNYENSDGNNTNPSAASPTRTAAYTFDGRGQDMTTWGGLKIKLDGMSFNLDVADLIQNIGNNF